MGTLPPSLRFHAGGERSIRGYGWREVGPRVGAQGQRFAVGARNVVTASAEYEQYLDDRWGYALFVDTGSAFNRRPDMHTGVASSACAGDRRSAGARRHRARAEFAGLAIPDLPGPGSGAVSRVDRRAHAMRAASMRACDARDADVRA